MEEQSSSRLLYIDTQVAFLPLILNDEYFVWPLKSYVDILLAETVPVIPNDSTTTNKKDINFFTIAFPSFKFLERIFLPPVI